MQLRSTKHHGDILRLSICHMLVIVQRRIPILLTAMQIYAAETGDASVFDFLPKKSYESLSSGYIRAHLWVNHDISARGSGDAARRRKGPRTRPGAKKK